MEQIKMFNIVFTDLTETTRSCTCSSYHDAITVFHALTDNFLSVYLYGEPDQHGRVQLLTEYHNEYDLAD
jgi:hypothetical protein